MNENTKHNTVDKMHSNSLLNPSMHNMNGITFFEIK